MNFVVSLVQILLAAVLHLSTVKVSFGLYLPISIHSKKIQEALFFCHYLVCQHLSLFSVIYDLMTHVGLFSLKVLRKGNNVLTIMLSKHAGEMLAIYN